MSLDHEQASLLLTDLLAGRLADPVRREVEIHAESCPECQQAREALEILAAVGEVGSHPSSEEIVACALRDECSFEPPSPDVAEHVVLCPQCRRLVRSVQRAERAALRSSRDPGGESSGIPASTRLVALAAAAALALLAYPAWLGLRGGVRAPQGVSGVVPLAVLTAPLRGGGETQTVVIREGVPLVFLVVRPALPMDVEPGGTVRFTVEQPEGEEVWRGEMPLAEAVRSMADPGAIVLAVPARSLAVGRAQLAVQVLGADYPAQAAVRFEVRHGE